MISLTDIFGVLATIVGVAMASSGFPQAVRIFRRKRSSDISLWSPLIVFMGGIIWIIYGFIISNFPIIISNGLGVIAQLSILIGYLKYCKEAK